MIFIIVLQDTFKVSRIPSLYVQDDSDVLEQFSTAEVC